mmetsp:Transcript_8719/g.15827  ORF Transcript_8719/g.15827 Transcript_8719/m.15827 type:complete len:713 (-) Transcript_8719:38-2176(-)|eukprot:CAMPEP_0182504880 /NCGR_PEP_ID=MMETSP1321-20130603/18056_1 /TAXON_ID=91990 /ORGANISM="Bolidomonas sp., Strain RCC1657" /LENGTH=712 /DNA_ID=CAMNT_0024710319 /DNA_START=105 /DNA_END=2243 /DNA_ORIENTATION=-
MASLPLPPLLLLLLWLQSYPTPSRPFSFSFVLAPHNSNHRTNGNKFQSITELRSLQDDIDAVSSSIATLPPDALLKRLVALSSDAVSTPLSRIYGKYDLSNVDGRSYSTEIIPIFDKNYLIKMCTATPPPKLQYQIKTFRDDGSERTTLHPVNERFEEVVDDRSGMYEAGTALSRITTYSEEGHVTETKYMRNGEGSVDVTARSDDAEGNLIIKRKRNGDQLPQVERYERTVQIPMSQLSKVPGCTSITQVGVIVYKDKVRVFGVSDAAVSRGIMWLVCNVLSGNSVEEVLNCDASEFTSRIGLDVGLSEGRGNGIGNIVRTVQKLLRGEGPRSTTTNTVASERPRTAVLLSGGVDSSVALNLLKETHDVTAFYLKIWLEDELAHLGQCPWEDDWNVCVDVCEQAGVPLESMSLQKEYKEKIISYTIEEAKMGRTPNPDVMCNSRVKFGCFLEGIADRGFDYVASGHYAQLEDNGNGGKRLIRGVDPVKDQSYFLCGLTQAQLKNVIFPVGSFPKSEVRELAEKFQLPNRHRPDSQGLCFLGKVKFDDFIREYLGEDEGDVFDAGADEEEIIGRHKGLWFHTVGQRKGLGGVLDVRKNSQGPWYVVAKDVEKNRLFVSNKYDEERFEGCRKELRVQDIHWLEEEGEGGEGEYYMKIRHGPSLAKGKLELDAEGGKIVLDEKDGGLAAGQFVAFYDEDAVCVGSAVIAEASVM